MKYLLVLLVVVAGAWLLLGRGRGARRDGLPGQERAGPRVPPAGPPAIDAVTMVACAHCGVHVPAAELCFDTAGRPYCSEAHSVAGPR
jgi:uncharacterized protein